eukprot:SAG31_NODE_3487_length_4209_cov_3.729684_2_plen_124_part_00
MLVGPLRFDLRVAMVPIHGVTSSISALYLAIKVLYFSNSWHKNEKVVTAYLMQSKTTTPTTKMAAAAMAAPIAILLAPSSSESASLVRVVSSTALQGDTFSFSALHLAIKVPYFSDSGHKTRK